MYEGIILALSTHTDKNMLYISSMSLLGTLISLGKCCLSYAGDEVGWNLDV